ncbi:hypothetical protein [Crocinitomix algicola]|uniref:hypothetical protein n=1 Tax=Crocinitomix algicola TaxID=1740263 RepID=UPI00087285D8|nr:hypothetical protein [Crocinitomix algicola]
MKKILFILVLSISTFSNAQVYKHSLGLQFEHYNRWAPSLNYQLGLSPRSRLSFSLNGGASIGNNSQIFQFQSSIYYQHVWNIKGGLNWYLGAGINGFHRYDDSYLNKTSVNRLGLGLQFGLEYDFNKHGVPLILSYDIKPTIGYSNHQNQNLLFNTSSAFTLKYTIGGLKKSKR